MRPEIVWLDEREAGDPALVGGKALNLSRLWGVQRIPPAFCVTTAAHRRWAAATAGEVPRELAALVAAAYRELARRCAADEPSVAVRSSATREDHGEASYAGQYVSVLNVAGAHAVASAVAQCWSSASSERVEAYRSRHAATDGDRGLAVLVQELVVADVSCVVFSVNPVTGDPGEVVVNANWGLGESVVSGLATPDAYVAARADLGVRERRIGDKERMVVPGPGGTREVPLPRTLRRRAVLEDERIAELARLAITLEHRMGWPVDLECAYRGDTLYLLQCRPITTLPGGCGGTAGRPPTITGGAR